MRDEAARVEVVCVGTELLSGQVNTHAAFLAERFRENGLRLLHEASVPDEEEEIALAVGAALSRSDAVLVLGGLGPTFDDLTREGVARALRRPLVYHAEIMRGIRALFRTRGLGMAPANRRQAWMIQGAQILKNRRGSAPGQLIRLGSGPKAKLVALLPGPWHELRPMFDALVLPRLKRFFGTPKVSTLSLHLSGIIESEVDRRVRPIVRGHPGVTFTILASGGLVHLHATDYRARGREDPGKLRGELLARVGRWVCAEGSGTMEAAIGEALRRRGQRLAVAESLTGGLLGHLLTEIPGSSDYFLGGTTAYANGIKERLLGVRPETLQTHGAVSRLCAIELAEGTRRLFGADWAVSLTGIAGPSGGSKLKPVGRVWIGLAGPQGAKALQRQFAGDRGLIKIRAARAALALLWEALKT